VVASLLQMKGGDSPTQMRWVYEKTIGRKKH
jgi:hypothetical protein